MLYLICLELPRYCEIFCTYLILLQFLMVQSKGRCQPNQIFFAHIPGTGTGGTQRSPCTGEDDPMCSSMQNYQKGVCTPDQKGVK